MDKTVTSEDVLVGGDFLMVMLIVIWVVLERFMGVLGFSK